MLIINHGDGSEFFGRTAEIIDDLAPAPPATDLIGLLLPAVQKVREAAPGE